MRPPRILERVRRALEAQVPQQVVRDMANRARYGASAPLSAMPVYPKPRDIKSAYAPGTGDPRLRRQQTGKVLAGDWDLRRAPITLNQKLVSCQMHWIDGADWEETPTFRKMLGEIAAGHAPDGCRSRDDLIARYRRLDEIFEQTKARGRLLNIQELSRNGYRRAHGAPLVHVARDGSCLRSGGGAHRFAIAWILDLPEMPAQLGVIHPGAIDLGILDTLRRSAF